MGQIVITIPTNKNLQYEIESKQECKDLIKILDSLSSKVNGNGRLSEEELDYRDGMEALAAKTEMLRTGKFTTLEDLITELGLNV